MTSSERPVALVTGGTRGIGKGISEALAEDGFDLLLTYGSNAEAAEEHATKLRAGGTKVALASGDIAEEKTIETYFTILAAEFPGQKLKALVHNAGQYVGLTSENSAGVTAGDKPKVLGSLMGEDGKIDLSHFDYYHRIYAKAWVHLVERAVPLFVEGGSVVGISGMGCNTTQQPTMSYDMPGSAKTVMETTARYYAKNLAPKAITVNVVIPGITSSDAWKALGKGKGKQGDEYSQTLGQMLCPMGRAAAIRELGDAVAFLCSPRARYITGVALPVDGGLHLGRHPPSGPPKGADGKGADGKGSK